MPFPIRALRLPIERQAALRLVVAVAWTPDRCLVEPGPRRLVVDRARFGVFATATTGTIWMVTWVPDARLVPTWPRRLLVERATSGAFVTSQIVSRGVLRGHRADV